MKLNRAFPRRLGLSIPGITDVILTRLDEPFDLIAQWTRFVSLDVVLTMSMTALDPFEENDDSKTTTLLSTWLPGVIIPTNLRKRTEDFRKRTDHWRTGPPYYIRLFLTTDGYVTRQEFFEATMAALIGIQP